MPSITTVNSDLISEWEQKKCKLLTCHTQKGGEVLSQTCRYYPFWHLLVKFGHLLRYMEFNADVLGQRGTGNLNSVTLDLP